MKRSVAAGALTLAVCFTAGLAPAALAQKAAKTERKVLVSVQPEYSDLLRRAQIGGLVRLKVTVTAEGKVTKAEIAGGNPILADSAVRAVMSWKFAPAAAQSIEDVSFSFTPH